MRSIIKIAKAELRYFFYSPIAWIGIIAFFVLCAIAWSNIVPEMAVHQEWALENSKRFKDWEQSLTRVLVGQEDGLIHTIVRYLYIFIPLIGMGLISREMAGGTNKLLFSSPIRIRQVVIGKFLGFVFFNLLLIAIAAFFLGTVIWMVQFPDTGLLLSAIAGFFLLMVTYSAIALFMSSLTQYPVIAAISTFLVLAVLTYAGMFFQRYVFVRDLTWFLTLSGRTEKLINGLITTKDVSYFLLVSAMFVGFTIIRVKAGLQKRTWYVNAVKYLSVLAIVLLLGYTTSRPSLTGYWDVTSTKANTVSPEIQKILGDFEKDSLEVVLYTNLLGAGVGQGMPESRNSYLANPWERYTRFKPDIRFRYEYYYDVLQQGVDTSAAKQQEQAAKLKEMATGLAEMMFDQSIDFFQSPVAMRKKINLQEEGFRLVMQLKYKGRSTFLRTFDDPIFWPTDAEMSAALKRIQVDSPPAIYFLKGNLERNITKNGEREYSAWTTHKGVRSSLVNSGFDCDTLNLDIQDIPSSLAALVMADPKTEMSSVSKEKVKKYIDAGGNLLVFGEPGKQAMVNPILQQLGVRLMEGQLVEPSYHQSADKVSPFVTDSSSMLSVGIASLITEKKMENKKVWGLMPGATAVEQTDSGTFNATSQLVSVPGVSWLKKEPLVMDSAAPVFNRQEGDSTGSFVATMALTRQINNKEQKIVIAGDADFTSNLRLNVNYVYAIALCSWINDGAFPVHSSGKKIQDVLLAASGDTANFLNILWLYILPAVLVVAAIILLIRRKRK